jgi:hypothetical protein
LLDKHGEAIEADLRRYYGVRVRDLFDPASDLSPREVFSLLIHMPTDSAYHAELAGGPQFRDWNAATYLLANVQDLLQGANYQRAGGKGRKPKPAYRPKRKGAGGTPLKARAPKVLRKPK